MDEFRVFKRRGQCEARQHVVGEPMDGISVNAEDAQAVQRPGGWVLRNPDNHADQWYVNGAFFAKNYEAA